MPDNLIYFHFVPFAGFLADVAALIFFYFLPRENRLRTAFIVGYLGMASWNFLTFLNYVSDASESYRLLYYVHFHFVHLIHIGLVLFALRVTARSARVSAYVLTLVMVGVGTSLVLTNLWFFVPGFEMVMLRGMRLTPWGKAPVAGWGAHLFHVVVYGSLTIGHALLIGHGLRHRGDRRVRWSGMLFLANAIGGLSNLAVFWGFDGIPPLGNGIDALVSALLAALFFRYQYMRRFGQVMLRVASGFAATGIALLVIWFVAEVAFRGHHDSVNLMPVMLLVSVLTVTLFQVLFSPSTEGDSFERTYEKLRRDYNLTHQEAMICRYVGEARDRKQILEILNISQNTLKVQLTSVYRKTIDRDQADAFAGGRPRAKFVELAQFVSELRGSAASAWEFRTKPRRQSAPGLSVSAALLRANQREP